MRFLVDANVIVYSVAGGRYQEPCLDLLEAIAGSDLEGLCTVAVAEEVWHLELGGRIPGLRGQTARIRTLFFPLLPVTHAALDGALAITADPELLGANDRLHVGSCLEHGIRAVVSADRGFDSVSEIERIDPLEGDLIERLRAA